MKVDSRHDSGAGTAYPDDKSSPLHDTARQMLVLGRVIKLVLQQARNRMGDSFAARMGDGQLFVLYALEYEGQLTAGELADRCQVADPTMSKTLNHLEANGLVTRQTDPTNRRVVRVSLTEEGRATLGQVETELLGSLSQVLSPLSESQLSDLRVAMAHLRSLAGAEDSDHHSFHNPETS